MWRAPKYKHKVVVKSTADWNGKGSEGPAVVLEGVESGLQVFEMSIAPNRLCIRSPRPCLIVRSDHRLVERHHIAKIVDK